MSELIERVIKEEGGFQSDPADSGNFHNGVNYGTKYGITPAAWLAYYNKPLQKDTIKNLTTSEAAPIYEKNYLRKTGTDKIQNESVKALVLFIVVNSGTGLIKSVKQIANATAGQKLVSENSNGLTDSEASIINGLNQELFFSNIKAVRKKFYENLAARDAKKAKFLKGWLSRLDKHVYTPTAGFQN